MMRTAMASSITSNTSGTSAIEEIFYFNSSNIFWVSKSAEVKTTFILNDGFTISSSLPDANKRVKLQFETLTGEKLLGGLVVRHRLLLYRLPDGCSVNKVHSSTKETDWGNAKGRFWTLTGPLEDYPLDLSTSDCWRLISYCWTFEIYEISFSFFSLAPS